MLKPVPCNITSKPVRHDKTLIEALTVYLNGTDQFHYLKLKFNKNVSMGSLVLTNLCCELHSKTQNIKSKPVAGTRDALFITHSNNHFL